jgi:hypothetical protein
MGEGNVIDREEAPFAIIGADYIYLYDKRPAFIRPAVHRLIIDAKLTYLSGTVIVEGSEQLYELVGEPRELPIEEAQKKYDPDDYAVVIRKKFRFFGKTETVAVFKFGHGWQKRKLAKVTLRFLGTRRVERQHE